MTNRLTTRLARLALLLALMLVLGSVAAQAQNSRDDWKPEKLRSDLLRNLPRTLDEAPIVAAEREQIYTQVVAGLRRLDLLVAVEPDEQRETVMRSPIGRVHLSDHGGTQLLVQAPRVFCGNGGCPLWLFVERRGRWELALDTGGGALLLRDTTNRHFHDIVTVWHMSGREARFAVYRWDGRRYRSFDCYDAEGERDSEVPRISSCPA